MEANTYLNNYIHTSSGVTKHENERDSRPRLGKVTWEDGGKEAEAAVGDSGCGPYFYFCPVLGRIFHILSVCTMPKRISVMERSVNHTQLSILGLC